MAEVFSDAFVAKLVAMGERPEQGNPDRDDWRGPPGEQGVVLVIGSVHLFVPISDVEAVRAVAGRFSGGIRARLVLEPDVQVEAPPEPKAPLHALQFVSRADLGRGGGDSYSMNMRSVVGCDGCGTKAYQTILGFQFTSAPHTATIVVQGPPGWVRHGDDGDQCPRCAEAGVGAPSEAPSTADIGARVAELRKAARLSREELATRARLSRDEVDRLEQGADSPTVETLGRLASALGVSLANLIAERDRG
jgi:DNA-binding XRE family transcriptional regulator